MKLRILLSLILIFIDANTQAVEVLGSLPFSVERNNFI
jgi:hypothetical protein